MSAAPQSDALATVLAPLAPPDRGGGRDLSLDVMRGLAIVLMVEVHSTLHFAPTSLMFRNVLGSLGMLAAPFFLMCAGMAVGYLQGRYASRRNDLRKVLLRRGLFLVIFATLLGLIKLNPQRLIDWDVFTLIGVMYIIVAATSGLDWRGALAGIAAVMTVNLLLPMHTPGILRGGSFPITPYAAYFLIGLSFASLRRLLHRSVLAPGLVGLSAVIIMAAAILRPDRLLHVTRSAVGSTAGILVIAAIFLGLWVIDRSIEARWHGFERVVMPLVRLGRLSFSLYYVQYFFLFLVPRGVSILLHRDLTLALPSGVWVAALLLFLGFLYLIVVTWSRFGFKWSLEWFMSTYVSPRSMFTAPLAASSRALSSNGGAVKPGSREE